MHSWNRVRGDTSVVDRSSVSRVRLRLRAAAKLMAPEIMGWFGNVRKHATRIAPQTCMHLASCMCVYHSWQWGAAHVEKRAITNPKSATPDGLALRGVVRHVQSWLIEHNRGNPSHVLYPIPPTPIPRKFGMIGGEWGLLAESGPVAKGC